MKFEHFYIKDQKANINGWEQTYTFLKEIEKNIQTINTAKPDSFINRDAFSTIFKCASFLHTLCTQQAVRLQDFLPRLTILINTSQSVLTMYEDERMEDMAQERCREIVSILENALEGALTLVNNQKFIMPVEGKSAAADILDKTYEEKDPVLTVNSSYADLNDAMRVMLRRMRDSGESVEALLSPQERLFFEIREQLDKTVKNFCKAAAMTEGKGVIQFAHGTVAVQGRIDRKGLKRLPHHIVQMAGTAMCPGFSSRDSDIQTPTYFLHNQKFIVFDPGRIASSKFLVSDTLRDKIYKIREIVMQSPKRKGYTDVLENTLQHKTFPKIHFAWIIETETYSELDLKPSLKAELAF